MRGPAGIETAGSGRAAGRRAAVVGAGPNGLSAAIVLARAGAEVTVYEAGDTPGGAARSADLFGSGTVVDLGAAAHPLAIASPFLRGLDLERHGLEWVQPDIAAAHPLDDGPAALLYRGLEATVLNLGRDGRAWRRLFAPLVEHWREVSEAVLGPLLRRPEDPVSLLRFGTRALLPATAAGRIAFRGEHARALFAGNAAHSFVPLHHPLTSAYGLVLGAAAHAGGWPVARGGTQAITDALVAELTGHGGTVVTGSRITDLAKLGAPDLTLLDVGPPQALALLGDRLPRRVARELRAWRYGAAAYKVDYLLDGAIPWTDERVGGAGTVHLGGTLTEIAVAEDQVHRGIHPERPFVLLCQQSAIDPSRVPAGRQVVSAYAHTPAGSTEGSTGTRIDQQIERFAPGFRDRVVERIETTPGRLEAWNPNLVGGDIAGGSAAGTQQVFRPRPGRHPYALGVPGVYLCSASTPPGAGVHGMSGYHAATAALADLG